MDHSSPGGGLRWPSPRRSSSSEGAWVPGKGIFGRLRGRTELIAEAEEMAPPPLEASPPGGGVHAFPLFFREQLGERRVLEALWPLFEAGRSSESGGFSG